MPSTPPPSSPNPQSPIPNLQSPIPLSSEPLAASPLWLQRSGLPEWLNAKVNRSAWLVFKTLVETDCARNARPATFEIAPAELARDCGLDAATVMRTLEALRRKKCIALFLPEHPEETALVEIKIPLPIPRPLDEILEEFPFNRIAPGTRLRYMVAGDAAPSAAATGAKKALERVIDLYFNVVGMKMNTFILDELRLVCQRFEAKEVEKVFARAAKNDIRSLGWIVKELYRTNRRRAAKAHDEKKR